MRALARVATAYGEAAHDAAHVRSPLTESRLYAAVEEAERLRDRVAEGLLIQTGETPEQWQVYGALLAALDLILAEFDPRSGRGGGDSGGSGSAVEAAESLSRLRREAPQTVRRLRPRRSRPDHT